MRRGLYTVFRRLAPAAVALTCLGFLGLRVDLLAVSRQLSSLGGWYLALAVVTVAGSVVISAIRYREILNALTHRDHSLFLVVRITFTTLFLSVVLPLAAAADGARMALAKTHLTLRWRDALESVVCDRLLAMSGLSLCVLVSLPVQYMLGGPWVTLVTELVVVTGVLLATWLLLWAAHRRPIAALRWVAGMLATVRTAATQLGTWRTLRMQLLLAVALVVPFCATVWLAAQALGLQLSATAALAFGPAIYLSQVVPFFYAGFGVREATSVVLLSGSGLLPLEASFALSIVVGLCNLVCAGLGAVFAGTLSSSARVDSV